MITKLIHRFIEEPEKITIHKRREYSDGSLLWIGREHLSPRIPVYPHATLVWVTDKRITFFFVDRIGESIRNLSHKISILSCKPVSGAPITMHHDEYYYIPSDMLSKALILKLWKVTKKQSIHNIDWDWEIDTSRKQLLGGQYTNKTQSDARLNYMDRLRYISKMFRPVKELPSVFIDHVYPADDDQVPSRLVPIAAIGSLLIVTLLLLL